MISFYTFNEANLYYDFYNTCTILSIDPNNKNNEKLRSFTMDGFYARPSAGMLCLSALYSITSIFRSNTDQPLPIQEEPHELEQTIPENDVPLETEQSQSKKANPVVVQRTRPDHGNYHTLERDSQPQEFSSIY